MAHAVLAMLSSTIYFISFILFRVAAERMPPLRGSRPVLVVRHMLTDWIWFVGGLFLFVGLIYQVAGFSALPPSTAQPLIVFSLALLIAYAAAVLGERLSAREWTCLALFGVATVLVGLSAGERGAPGDLAASPVAMVAVAVPSLLIAALVWLVGDRRSSGRHAKKLAGVAYGIGAGVCAGLAETGILGMAAIYHEQGAFRAVLWSPYPYLTLFMAGVSLVQLQVALQRCRLAIVASIITVVGRIQLVISSAVLFGNALPDEPLPLVLRALGFGLALTGLIAFPRYVQAGPEPAPERVPAAGRLPGPAIPWPPRQ